MPEKDQLKITRDEDFTSLYANNVLLESTLWDLKFLFGQVDVAESKIVQHTAISVPWPQAKLMAYFMALHVILHQADFGAILVPPALIPPRPGPSDQNLKPEAKKTFEYLAWVHEQFFGNHSYIPPNTEEPGALSTLDEAKS